MIWMNEEMEVIKSGTKLTDAQIKMDKSQKVLYEAYDLTFSNGS